MSAPEPIFIPPAFRELNKPARYKVYWGGRGGGKSVSFARALIVRAHTKKVRILCTREFQNSITDSVHRTIAAQIAEMNLDQWFEVQQKTITGKAMGSEFIFKGLHNNIGEIKSMYGVDLVWIEEASSISEESWLILDPTIRADNSEIWISFNPHMDGDPIYQRFVVRQPPPNAIVRKVNWNDNPRFPEQLKIQREYSLQNDLENYGWIWEGETRVISEAAVFRDKLDIRTFDEPPPKTEFYHGIDFGFSVDPTAMLRCWIQDNEDKSQDLMIDREAYGHKVDLDELPDFLDRHIETARSWPILADAASPAIISFLSRRGFHIKEVKKYSGSVEDGIAHLRGFRKIVIHETKCPESAREFRIYKYKESRIANSDGKKEVLPILEDKNDHCPDAARYALGNFIQGRGGLGVWLRLTQS